LYWEGCVVFYNCHSVWDGIKILLNGEFSVRECVVKLKGKIMVVSYGETSGFSAVNADALMLVNGGKGSQEGGAGIPMPLDPGYRDYPEEDRPYDNNGQTNPNSPFNSSDSSGSSGGSSSK
jgi:hypothetical protein